MELARYKINFLTDRKYCFKLLRLTSHKKIGYRNIIISYLRVLRNCQPCQHLEISNNLVTHIKPSGLLYCSTASKVSLVTTSVAP